MSWLRNFRIVLALALGALLLMACLREMYDQPRYEPLQRSTFFEDGQASRPLEPGTIARGQLRIDDHLYTGRSDGRMVDTFPFPITQEVLERGQERYNIYCTPCHGAVGDGQGIIIQRGFTEPPSFHTRRLRNAPAGYYYAVITNGVGAMFDFADKVKPEDRWAVIAYIRALQLSQNASLDDLTPEERQLLEDLTE